MIKSNSELYLAKKKGEAPPASVVMAGEVSQFRREGLEDEILNGKFRDGNSPPSMHSYGAERTPLGNVVGSGLKKQAQGFTTFNSGNTTGSGYRGEGGTFRQVQEVYSPLWLNSNLNLPRDRATINAWSRSFFALNPIVQNAITLHSTYPISKLNIKCKNSKVNAFFENMIDEIDLMNVCVQIAQEFFTIGETFPYAELDEGSAKWSRILIQNPDYVDVKRSVIAGEPIISLRPDENLMRIVRGNRPADIAQRQQLDRSIIEHVRRGENIPLSNFYVSHIARKISPYEVRGTGLPVSCFRQLMLFDKLRECHSEDTEVLTRQGFQKISDITEISQNTNPNSNYVNGVQLDKNNEITGIYKLKDDVEVACFNTETEEVEYHKPVEFHMSYYEGEMIHFTGKKVDCLVSPNHKMLTKTKKSEWNKITASEMLQKKTYWKFRSHAKWNGKKIDTVNVCGKDIDANMYLEFLGYMASEGCIYSNFNNGRYDSVLLLNQLSVGNKHLPLMNSINKFASCFDKSVCSNISVKGSGYSADVPKEMWEGRLNGKELVNHFLNEIGNGKSAKSHDKRLPRWVMDLCPEQLQILLNALMYGDGSCSVSKYAEKSKSYRYSTVSKQLADDVYEIVWKLGYVPNIHVSVKSDDREVVEYIVLWSDTNYGREPYVYTGNKKSGNGGGASCKKVDYSGSVWCFEVPTGAFITRRNNRISIHGNSKFAQADNLINPLTLVKIGGGADNYKPVPADLEMWREVFECYDDETEVLTDKGFKLFKDVIDVEEVNGKVISKPKSEIKVGCFNPSNEKLEFLAPESSYCNNYNGEMYHYHNNKIDIKVTPDHDLWVSQKKYEYNPKRFKWDDFKKVKAKELNLNDYSKFRSVLNWDGDSVDGVEVDGKTIPIELYLEFMGYLVSEGCLYTNDKHQYTVGICQSLDKYYSKMKGCIEKVAAKLNKHCINSINNKAVWTGSIAGKHIYDHFYNQISDNGNSYSFNKKLPRWILNLNSNLLNILLEALVDGDGSRYENKNGTWRKTYWTTSKQLANDVQEIVLKCGYSSIVQTKQDNRDSRRLVYYVQWSNSCNGDYPLVYKNSRNSITKEKHSTIDVDQYNGKIWCFTVPTGLFVTRRNGKITIQGNSAQYDKDFKIFTHDGVSVEPVGLGQGIYDISGDVTQLLKEIYIGLMVPQVIMDGGADVTYANGGVALDVLRQRYMQFRNMLSNWLRRKIFAPIAKINDFYDRKDGEKILIVPEVEWNHMSLFDMGDYIQNLSQLLSQEPRKVSLQTLYKSLGLEYEDEMRKIRTENIQMVVQAKEMEALQRMSLNDLRSIGEEDEIQEVTESPLPGEQPYDQPGQGPQGMGGGMDMGLGGGGGGMGGGLPPPPGGGLGGGGLGGPPMGGAPAGGGGAPSPPV